jgi:hypothetical protein
MNTHIEQLKKAIEPYRQQIIQHKVYAVIDSIEALRVFMQHHIYAVWDFMSLLKTLQNQLTCTQVPWFPKGSAETRYLINEIVVGEESDIDQFGKRISHFELYIQAMRQCGADTSAIEDFVQALSEGKDFETAFRAAHTPLSAQAFVNFTFEIIQSRKDYLQAAIFTFGREDLIPDMFLSIIQDLHMSQPEKISGFKYYLDRHIEVDGDHHSHLALEMTAQLCGEDTNKWAEATKFAIASLKSRIGLWDGVYAEILEKKSVLSLA